MADCKKHVVGINRVSILAVMLLISATVYGYSRFYPLDALAIYAEFKTAECSVCSVKELDRAAGLLDKVFPPDLVVDPGRGGLVKTGICGENELQLDSDAKRRVYKSTDYETFYYPAVVFRFHTLSRDMAGIDAGSYSSARYDAVYDSGSMFTGRIKLVSYRHGDGRTFVYDRERHVVQVHCMVLEMKKK